MDRLPGVIWGHWCEYLASSPRRTWKVRLMSKKPRNLSQATPTNGAEQISSGEPSSHHTTTPPLIHRTTGSNLGCWADLRPEHRWPVAGQQGCFTRHLETIRAGTRGNTWAGGTYGHYRNPGGFSWSLWPQPFHVDRSFLADQVDRG